MPWQTLRFLRTGQLWSESDGASVLDWPDSAVVCNCRGVKRGELGVVIDGGCDSIACLSKQTGASTVCGSCKPLLGELLSVSVDEEKAPGNRILMLGSVFAFFLAVLWLFMQPVPTINSVESTLYQLGNLWRDGLFKQVSGFVLLGLSLLGLILSMRKRWKRFTLASFGSWRAFHAVLGVIALFTLVLHTGLYFGENLNAWLLADFLLIGVFGALAGYAAVSEQRHSGYFNKRLRRWANRLHLFISWPLPVLLGFHIVSVYYF
jgi:nitrite reductase (NADH) large subunit